MAEYKSSNNDESVKKAAADKKVADEAAQKKNQGAGKTEFKSVNPESPDKAKKEGKDDDKEQVMDEKPKPKANPALLMKQEEGQDVLMGVYIDLNNLVQELHPVLHQWTNDALGNLKSKVYEKGAELKSQAMEKGAGLASDVKNKVGDWLTKKPAAAKGEANEAKTSEIPTFMTKLNDGGNPHQMAQADMSKSPATSPLIKPEAKPAPSEDKTSEIFQESPNKKGL